MASLRYSLPEKIRRNIFVEFLFEWPRYPPPIAWIPFIILFSGIGYLPSLAIVVIGVFPATMMATYDGLERIPLDLRRLASSMELGRFRFLFNFLLPAVLPQILTGMRIGLGMGWMSIIAAEMVSGQSGLGYSLNLNRLNLRWDWMLADFIAIGLTGFLLQKGFAALEHVLFPWIRGRSNAS